MLRPLTFKSPFLLAFVQSCSNPVEGWVGSSLRNAGRSLRAIYSGTPSSLSDMLSSPLTSMFSRSRLSMSS